MSAAATTPAIPPRHETVFHLQQAFKLALSLVLFYWLALSMNWDEPQYGGLAIVIISLGTAGASIEKGILRVVGTTVGVAVGFLILGLFNHDRWATMLAFAVYIAVIGYFMQASRNSYAWYVAAFVPLVVWGDNYPNFDSAFYFGTFRYLNTTVGVLIYTTVDLVFWPRHAGDQLNGLGRDLWARVREQFRNYRGQLDHGRLPEGASDLGSRVAGILSAAVSTLQDAYFDTPDVSGQKRVWEAWSASARAIVDALELWRESIDDCRGLDLDRLLPQLGAGLDMLDKRLERMGDLWETRLADDNAADTNDSSLVASLALDFERSACAELSHWQRAAFMNFLEQLRNLDQASRELLRTMRVLAGLHPSRGFRVSLPGQDMLQPARWDPERLIHALFPPAAFIAAFYFWVFVYPPPGARIPMFAGILSLVLLRTPMNPLPVLVVVVLSIFFAVAPIYWLIMPGLSTGLGLLCLIFIYSFVFGYLGGRSPAFKMGPVLMFVVMTGISNQQRYSFNGPVDGALMVVLSGAIMTMVYFFFSPMRPEQALLRSLRRFFHGGARVTSGFAVVGPSERSQPHRASGRFVREPWASALRLIFTASERAKGWRLRKRFFQSMVLPAPAKIQSAQKNLDYKLYPDNGPEKVQRLHDAVQSIAYRLQSLEIAQRRIARHATPVPASLAGLTDPLRDRVRVVFEHWASLEPGDAFEKERESLQHLSRDLQQTFETLGSGQDQEPMSDQLRASLYAVLGTFRGLIAAMANAQGVMNQINWPQWAATRF